MSFRKRVHKGPEKDLFEGPHPGYLVQRFKDSAFAHRSRKSGVIDGKGVLNNRISEFLMTKLAEISIPTNFVRRLNMREQLIHDVEHLPVYLVVHNIVSKEFADQYGLKEGAILPRSIIEFHYRSEELGDPLVTEEHMCVFGWVSHQDIDDMIHYATRVNDFLSGLFSGVGIRLVEMTLSFGYKFSNGEVMIVIADEISPDNCRLWDNQTNDPMDKDRFAMDLGDENYGYREVARRLGILPEVIRETRFPAH